MPVLESRVQAGAEFEHNATTYAALIHELRDRHRRILAGGGERLQARHIERGKIPVRQRIDLLVDPLSPFLELSPLAAWELYGNEVPAAGIVTGVGLVVGPALHDHRQRRDGERRLLLPRDGKEASCARRRSRSRTACPASISSIAAARICRSRTAFFRTAITSVAPSSSNAACPPPGCRRSPPSSAAAPRGAPTFLRSATRW